MVRLLRLLIAAAAAVYLVSFAIQNRDVVDIVYWPNIAPVTVPVWGIAIGALAAGVVLAGIVIWLGGIGWRARAAEAQRKLRSQEARRAAAERREEEIAAARAAERRKAADTEQKVRPGAPALARTAAGTKPLALSSR